MPRGPPVSGTTDNTNVYTLANIPSLMKSTITDDWEQ